MRLVLEGRLGQKKSSRKLCPLENAAVLQPSWVRVKAPLPTEGFPKGDGARALTQLGGCFVDFNYDCQHFLSLVQRNSLSQEFQFI